MKKKSSLFLVLATGLLVASCAAPITVGILEQQNRQADSAEADVYAINNVTESSQAIAHGLPVSAKAGEKVSFTVLLKTGYAFKGSVSVHTGSIEDETAEFIKVSYSSSTKLHSFTMPEAPVELSILTEVGVFIIQESDPNSLISSFVLEDGTTVSNGSVIEQGTVITAKLVNTDVKLVTGIRVNGGELIDAVTSEAGLVTADFIMPAKNAVITAEFDHRYRDVTLVNETEHLTVEFYEKNEAGEYVLQETPRAIARESFFIKVTSNDEDFGVDAAIYEYSSNGTTWSGKTTLQLNSDGFYEYKALAYDFNRITVTEVGRPYKDKAFVGQYYGNNIYGNGTKSYSASSSYSVQLHDSGKGTIKGNDVSITSLDEENNILQATRTTSSSTVYKLKYSKDWVYAHYSATNGTFPSNDAMISCKAQSGDAMSLYTFISDQDSSTKFIFVTALRDGVEYKNMFVDMKLQFGGDGLYMDDVTFVYDEGTTTIHDTMAMYTINIAGEPKFRVESTGAGGSSNRTITQITEGGE